MRDSQRCEIAKRIVYGVRELVSLGLEPRTSALLVIYGTLYG